MNENIDKTKLIKKVVKKLSKNHYKTHVINVINILLDELIFDFLRGKALKLFNFCEISYKKYAPKKFINLFSKEMQVSSGKTVLVLKINKKLSSKLNSDIEIIKRNNE